MRIQKSFSTYQMLYYLLSLVSMHLYLISLEVPFDSFSKEAASVTLVKPWILHDSGLSCSQRARLILCSLLTLNWHHQTCLWSHLENIQVGCRNDSKEQDILEKTIDSSYVQLTFPQRSTQFGMISPYPNFLISSLGISLWFPFTMSKKSEVYLQ